jgi:hypothetical protein
MDSKITAAPGQERQTAFQTRADLATIRDGTSVAQARSVNFTEAIDYHLNITIEIMWSMTGVVTD